jgi:hypothetical protein
VLAPQTGNVKHNHHNLAAIVHRALRSLYDLRPIVESSLSPPIMFSSPLSDCSATLEGFVETARLPLLAMIHDFCSAHLFLRKLFTTDVVFKSFSSFGPVWRSLRRYALLIDVYDCEDEKYLSPLADLSAFVLQLENERIVADFLTNTCNKAFDNVLRLYDEYKTSRRRSLGGANYRASLSAAHLSVELSVDETDEPHSVGSRPRKRRSKSRLGGPIIVSTDSDDDDDASIELALPRTLISPPQPSSLFNDDRLVVSHQPTPNSLLVDTFPWANNEDLLFSRFIYPDIIVQTCSYDGKQLY